MSKQVYTLEDLRNWESATASESHPARYAVIGDPVAHSLSPQMQNAALEELGVPARYVRLHLAPAELKEGMGLIRTARFKGEGFRGVNVTIPHKAEVLKLADAVDAHARDMGVVNTLEIAGGKLHGSSTDGPGFILAVREELGVEIENLRVVVLGAGGGVGRAIAMQCALEKCRRLFLVNRTEEKTAGLAGELRQRFPGTAVSVHPWNDSSLAGVLQEADLIVNCSSVGMRLSDPSPLPAAVLSPRHMLYDTVYSGGKTQFVEAVEKAGGRTANGLSMLLYQGALSLEKWLGRKAPVEVMRTALMKAAATRRGV